ncbi:MAG TPA: hypothetical protein DCS93_36470 [Microscillaceae bacterium]|nr:hypothetical protein [Microscillaceae bacterium]
MTSYHIYKIRLIVGMVLLLSIHLVANADPKEKDCAKTLEEAKAAYEEGRINDVPNILNDCMDVFEDNKVRKGNFDRNQKIEAYRLLSLTYLYLNEEDNAEKTLLKLLKLEPEYRLKNNEPSEFKNLYGNFRVRPVLAFGGKGGGNIMRFNVSKTFSTNNPQSSTETYTSGVGFQIGGAVELPLNKKLGLFLETYFSGRNYTLNNELFGYASTNYEETQSWIEIPLGVRYNLGDKYNFSGHLKPYVFAGVSTGLLLNASTVVIRRDRVSSEELREVTGTAIPVTNLRNSLNISALFGAGVELKQGRGYLVLDVRYYMGLMNAVNAQQRYSINELIFKYGHIDNDFKINNIAISVGYMYPIYKPKKIR